MIHLLKGQGVGLVPGNCLHLVDIGCVLIVAYQPILEPAVGGVLVSEAIPHPFLELAKASTNLSPQNPLLRDCITWLNAPPSMKQMLTVSVEAFDQVRGDRAVNADISQEMPDLRYFCNGVRIIAWAFKVNELENNGRKFHIHASLTLVLLFLQVGQLLKKATVVVIVKQSEQ